MAGSLHCSARTTPQVRAELQALQETTGTLAQRYGLSRTTVAKWRNRTTTDDAPMGPNSPHSTVLTQVEEAMVVEFRRRTLLPLDDFRRSSGTTCSAACATASRSSPAPACIAASNEMASPTHPRQPHLASRSAAKLTVPLNQSRQPPSPAGPGPEETSTPSFP